MKRRVTSLARLDRDVVHLVDGPVLVRIRRFIDAPHAVKVLRAKGRLDRATLARVAELESPPIPFEPALFATFEHDLALLATQRPLLREHRRALARHGSVDREWLDDKAGRLEVLRRAQEPARWTDALVELVVAMRGADEGEAVAKTFALLDADPGVRQAKAFERILAIAKAMQTGEAPEDVRALYERLAMARDWPGRAKKRRMLDVLRQAIGWAELPVTLLEDDFVDSARRAIAMWPVVRDEETVQQFAINALHFRLGAEDVLLGELAGLMPGAGMLDLRTIDLTLNQAIRLMKLASSEDRDVRQNLARHVAAGLDLELLRGAAERKQLGAVADLEDVRSARAFITWSTRLRDHYAKHKLELRLSPDLFRSLPKNEDLAVLTLCLLDQHAEPTSDPIGTLDATLGLFQRLPARAKALLAELRDLKPGEGRRLDPEFASWLDVDCLLDRAIHLARLAGEPAISATIREDFDRSRHHAGERAYLTSLPVRNERQQRRLDTLAIAIEPPCYERTIRRLRSRIERLMPRAYRRAMDETFRRLLREGWNIRLSKLTPSWREAVRFWLLVEDNRAHLEKLLREAAARPGVSVKDAFPASAAWMKTMRSRIDVDAWNARHRRVVEHAGARYTIELEEDPLEVLRMGIPFGTCLSLSGGSNAASTVMNAIDANKRVLYVRNAASKVVARKLLAITDSGQLVGYHLYRSVGGEEERMIETAVTRFCEDLSAACRAPLATGPAPRRIHGGSFWYDDGQVPFAGTSPALTEFCQAHGLAPVPEPGDDELANEAEAWRARHTGNLTLALAAVESSRDCPAMRVHDRWVVEKLGFRRALRSARNESTMAFALLHSLAVDETGCVLALEAAGRMATSLSDRRLTPLLAQFPPSPKTTLAFVNLARRAMKADGHHDEHGAIRCSLRELPARFEDVASALDLLDAIEPAWKSLEQSIEGAIACAAEALEAIYERAPEPAIIVKALMSRRRGEYAHRAALRVAACHVLPEGERALRRFAALRPELMITSDALAARARQACLASDDPIELARRKLVDPTTSEAEREVARMGVTDPANGRETAWWLRLASSCARIGDGYTAHRVLYDYVFPQKPVPLLSPGFVVDLWRVGEKATVIQSFKLTQRHDWSERILAVEREAAARGVDVTGLLESVALELAQEISPSPVVSPHTEEQLRRVLAVIVREASPARVAAVFMHLDDALSVTIFRDALAQQSAARVASIKQEIRKLDPTSDRTKTFLSWISNIGGIEST